MAATPLTSIEIDLIVNDGGSLAKSRQAVKQLREEMSNLNPEEDIEKWTALSAKIGTIRDNLAGAAEQAKIFQAGSDFEKASNSIDAVKEGLMNLDFDKAKEGAAALNATVKNMNPQAFNAALQGLGGTVKSLGSTFMQLGKMLLTNPIFLIAAVVTALVVVIVKLMDKLGILKVITKAVGAIFGWITDLIDGMVQGLKNFTDWLGISNNAALDAADAQAKSLKQIADINEEKSAGIINAYDHEIRMAKLAGEDTEKAERKKQYYIEWTAKARMRADAAAYVAAVKRGDLDAEEIEELRKKFVESKQLAVAEQKNTEYLIAQQKKQRQDANQKEKEDEKKHADDLAKQRSDAAKKAAEEARKAREAALKQIRQLEQEYQDSLLTDQQREILNVQRKYAESLKAAEKYGQDLSTLKAAQAKEEQAINDKYALEAEAKAKEVRTNELNALLELNTTQLAQKQAYLEEQKNIELSNKELTEAEKLLIEQKYAAASQQLIDESNQARISEIETLMQLRTTSLEQKQALLDEEMNLELANKSLSEEQKHLIEQEYHDKKMKLIEDEKKARMDEINAGVNGAMQGLQAVQGLSDAIFAAKMSKLEKGSAAELKAAKKQFEINKGLQIAQAVIQGVQATLAAYSSGSAIPIVGAVTGPVFAALAAATSIANIVKIKNAKFESPGSIGGGGGASNAPSMASAAAAATPSFNLFGTPNQGNNATATQSVEASQNMTIKAVVSETEITSTQQKVKKYSSNAEL